MKQTAEHLDFLDALRGLAALSVVWSHYILGYGLPTQSPWVRSALADSPLHIWWDGAAAVSLFFVLSGFVLSLKRFPSSDVRYGSYAFSRFCRIWLPYFVAFASFVALRQFVFAAYPTIPAQSDWIAGFWHKEIGGVDLMKEAALVWPVSKFKIIPQAWTLSIELTLSLLIPLLALVAARSTLLLLVFGSIAIIVLKVPIFLFHFVLGVLIAKWYRTQRRPVGGVAKSVLLALGLFLYTIRFSVPIRFPESIKEDPIWLLTGVGSALILITVLLSNTAQEILRHRFLTFLGRISYSTYLFHFSILLTVTPATLFLLNRIGVVSPFICWVLGILATTLATVAVSTVTQRFVEAPCIRLGKIFSQRRPATVHSASPDAKSA